MISRVVSVRKTWMAFTKHAPSSMWEAVTLGIHSSPPSMETSGSFYRSSSPRAPSGLVAQRYRPRVPQTSPRGCRGSTASLRGAFHEEYDFANNSPESKEAFQEVSLFFDKHLGRQTRKLPSRAFRVSETLDSRYPGMGDQRSLGGFSSLFH